MKTMTLTRQQKVENLYSCATTSKLYELAEQYGLSTVAAKAKAEELYEGEPFLIYWEGLEIVADVIVDELWAEEWRTPAPPAPAAQS